MLQRFLLVQMAIALGFASAAIPAAVAGDFWDQPAAQSSDPSPEVNDEVTPAPPSSPEEARAAEFQRHMERGDKLAIEAANTGMLRRRPGRRPIGWSHAKELAKQAVRAYERATGVAPNAAEPHFRAAAVLNRHLLSSDSLALNSAVLRDRKYADRALEHWRAFATLAPLDPRVTDTLFDQALVHTRLATEDDFRAAVRCYEILLERTSSAGGMRDFGTYYGNLAETYMMIGQLADAIATYERALEYGNSPIHGYGLAVALDRDGQNERAREVMLTYAMADRLSALQRDGVFFVPRGESDYYLGLGYETLGDTTRALKYYRRYIKSNAHPRYQPRAKAHIKALEATKKKPSRGKANKSDSIDDKLDW